MPTYTYTTLDDPSATNGTKAQGINDAGQIVGSYDAPSGLFTGGHGFLEVSGVYSTLDDTSALGCGHWTSGTTHTAARHTATLQAARRLSLHSPRAGGTNNLSGHAALTFHQPVAPHRVRSGAASTRRETPTPLGPRVGAARTIMPA
jgi:hypothetical protein